MKHTYSLLLAATCALTVGSAAATVTVTFNQPENYADMPFSNEARESTLKALRAHFDKLGTKLPAGQNLTIDVLDIDLAGRIRPNFRGNEDFRIMTGGADWPMIKLRYSIDAGGKVLKSGEERISDMNYMGHANLYNSGEPLQYEKRMLDTWFKRTLSTTQ